jgi:hypothetical protein
MVLARLAGLIFLHVVDYSLREVNCKEREREREGANLEYREIDIFKEIFLKFSGN